MRHELRWYEREHWAYEADKATSKEYARWLKQVDWQLFCTFTFAWRVSDQQAIQTFGEFVNRMEQLMRCDVGYVRGDEKRFSGCGKPACARHFHVLMTCTVPAEHEYVEALWMSMAGTRIDDAGAQVKPYDPNLNGASYVLKFINQVDGDWAMRKMHLFNPPPGEEKVRSRMRRHLRRHPALEQFRESQVHGGQSCWAGTWNQ